MAKDLRQRARDRSVLIIGLVSPLMVTLLITAAFGRTGVSFSADLVVVDADRSAMTSAFVQSLVDPTASSTGLTFTVLDWPDEARSRVAEGTAQAALIVPAGFGAAAAQSQAPIPVQVVRRASAPIAGDVAESVAAQLVARVNAGRVAAAVGAASSTPPPDPAALGQLAGAAAAMRPVTVAKVGTAQSQRSPGSMFAPAMGVFFMIFVVAQQATSLVTERTRGTLARMLAAPARPRAVLLGKAGASIALGLASLGGTAVLSSLLLSADWGPPLPAAILAVATVLAATGLMAVVLTFARTQRQAEAAASVLTFGMALIGGNFISLTQAPEALRTLSLLTPNGWALRGFDDLAAPGSGLGTIAVPVFALLAIASVGYGVAAARAKRLVAL